MERRATEIKSKPNAAGVSRILDLLKAEYELHELARVTGRNPFRVLIGGILSARTKDTQTAPVCKALFKIADTPAKLLAVKDEVLLNLIRPIGFYNQKAKAVKETCRILVEDYSGKVPDTLEELVQLPGVGRKVANLVLSNAFGKDAICVDTHVHRITNRLGWVLSRDVLDTENQLMKLVPKKRWRDVNFVFVRHGQERCFPQSPVCSGCPIFENCARIGVGRSR